MSIRIFVPGIARGSGSHTSYQGRITHAGKYTKQWMDAVTWMVSKEVARMCLWLGPAKLTLTFYRDRPKGHFKTKKGALTSEIKDSAPIYPTTRPDLTKLVRAVEDALTGVIWKDDSQVIEQANFKRYADAGQKPGVLIQCEEITVEDFENKS